VTRRPLRVRVPALGPAPAPTARRRERGVRIGRLLWRPLVGAPNALVSPLAVATPLPARDPGAPGLSLALDPTATWSDGRPVTVADVIHTLNGLQDGGAFKHVQPDPIDSHRLLLTGAGVAECVDALTPARHTAGGAPDLSVTNGPFRLARHDTAGARLTRVDRARDGALPDVVDFAAIEDLDAALSALRDGRLDVILEADELTAAEVLARPGPALVTLPDTARLVQVLGFNLASDAMRDVATRCAVARNIDRRRLVREIYGGFARPSEAPAPARSGREPAASSVAAFVLLVNRENRLRVRAARHLVDAWAAAGIRARVDAEPWNRFTNRLRDGTFDAFLLSVRDSTECFPDLWGGRRSRGLLAALTRFDTTEIDAALPLPDSSGAGPNDADLATGVEQARQHVDRWLPAVELTEHAAWAVVAPHALADLSLVALSTGAVTC
jgi:ABC-type transport system substrate-binding protein